MRFGTRAALVSVLLVTAGLATGCGANGLLGTEYEYEEDLTLSLDGSATLVVNASIPALVALRGIDLNTDPHARLDLEKIRQLYTSPFAQVSRVTQWTRARRRFVGIRLQVSDIRNLPKTAPFSWSTYSLHPKGAELEFVQTVGRSAFRPGTMTNAGWTGGELVAFRLHLPSRINFHNARDVQSNEPRDVQRGNIVTWEQQLSDRLEGVPLELNARMDPRSILYRTLWLFGLAFLAAIAVLGFLIWLTMRRGAAETVQSPF
jgi:hypothetical protein